MTFIMKDRNGDSLWLRIEVYLRSDTLGFMYVRLNFMLATMYYLHKFKIALRYAPFT